MKPYLEHGPFNKAVSQKNIFINKSRSLHTLQIHTIYKSLVETGQTLSFNHMDSSLFSFPSTKLYPLFYLRSAK